MNITQKLETLREIAYDTSPERAILRISKLVAEEANLTPEYIAICFEYLDILRQEVSKERANEAYQILFRRLWPVFVKKTLYDLFHLDENQMYWSQPIYPYCSVFSSFLGLKLLFPALDSIRITCDKLSLFRYGIHIFKCKISCSLIYHDPHPRFKQKILSSKEFKFQTFSELINRFPENLKNQVHLSFKKEINLKVINYNLKIASKQ